MRSTKKQIQLSFSFYKKYIIYCFLLLDDICHYFSYLMQKDSFSQNENEPKSIFNNLFMTNYI